MVENRQLSASDAETLAALEAAGVTRATTEEEVLEWLAQEYGLAYTALENSDPPKELLARFPARILLKEELLPLREENGRVEVALSRLFGSPGLDALRAITDVPLL